MRGGWDYFGGTVTRAGSPSPSPSTRCYPRRCHHACMHCCRSLPPPGFFPARRGARNQKWGWDNPPYVVSVPDSPKASGAAEVWAACRIRPCRRTRSRKPITLGRSTPGWGPNSPTHTHTHHRYVGTCVLPTREHVPRPPGRQTTHPLLFFRLTPPSLSLSLSGHPTQALQANGSGSPGNPTNRVGEGLPFARVLFVFLSRGFVLMICLLLAFPGW